MALDRDKAMWRWDYAIPLHPCNGLLNQVSGSGSARARAVVEKTEDPVLSVRLVFHRHAVACADALPPVHPYQCKLVRIILPGGAASVSMGCVTLQSQSNCYKEIYSR